MSKRSSRSHTKSGSGRYHGAGQLIAHPQTGAIIGVTQPVQRLAPAIDGGNWRGADYLSYREHDQLRRLTDARWMEGPTRDGFGPMTRVDAVAFLKSQRAA
jgi:hypothetical protein